MERQVIQSMLGATLALSAGRPDTFDAAGYQSTDVPWTVVGEVENYGNHGVVASVSEFTAVDDGVVQKIKGSKNYGTMNLMLGNIPSDTGQDLLHTAAESQLRYSARITYPLGEGEVTAEIHYLDVLVSKFEFQDGAVNDTRRISVDLALCRAPVIVAAT